MNEATIVRGTTPTLQFTFTQISPSDIVVAYLNLKQNNRTIIEKTFADSVVTEEGLAFTLTQADTLALSKVHGTVLLDWKTSNGVRGRSKPLEFKVEDPAKNEVI